MISRTSMKTNKIGRGNGICGFTLVELLLVLVLIAISMAAITPRIGESISRWQVRESSKNMLAVIRLTRQMAVTMQEVMVFALDTHSTSFAVKSVSHSPGSSGISNDFLVPRQFLGEGVKVVQLEGFDRLGGKGVIVFWPDGRAKKAHFALAAEKDSGKAEWHFFVENDGSVVLREALKNE
jgi:prepilin-type N-terminal cleavage/methylation domain-containing protein